MTINDDRTNDTSATVTASHASRILEAFRVWHGDTRAFFDRQL